MNDIPTKTIWLVLGTNSEDKMLVFDRYETEDAARKGLRSCEEKQAGINFKIEEHVVAIPDRTLPTPTQIQGICRVLHRGLVAIRNLGHAGDTLAMREIAESLHETPLEMFDERNWDWNSLALQLRALEKRFPEVIPYCLAAELEHVQNNEQA